MQSLQTLYYYNAICKVPIKLRHKSEWYNSNSMNKGNAEAFIINLLFMVKQQQTRKHAFVTVHNMMNKAACNVYIKKIKERKILHIFFTHAIADHTRALEIAKDLRNN